MNRDRCILMIESLPSKDFSSQNRCFLIIPAACDKIIPSSSVDFFDASNTALPMAPLSVNKINFPSFSSRKP